MARMRSTLVAATATIAAFAAPTTASAVTCSGLQDALDTAPSFGTVTLDEGQACNDHFQLPSRSITLQGGGSGATLSGVSKGNFQILAGHDTASTTIRNLTFLEGESQDNGGAIRLTGDNAVTIADNTFLGNHADDNGGAVSIDSQDQGPVLDVAARGDAVPVVLSGNTFGGTSEGDDNSADEDGGAVYINDPFRGVVVNDGNVFLGNRADAGGGLYVNQTPEFALLDNRFQDNVSFTGEGGGAAINACFGGEVTGNDFIGNEISTEGGSVEGGGLAVYRSGCDGKRSARGGDATELTQSGNLFQGNSIDGASSALGGGEYIEDFRTVSTDDSFVGNEISAFRQGGGGGLAYFGFVPTPLAARNLVAAGNTVSAEQQPAPERGVSEQSFGGGLFLIGNPGVGFRVEDSTIEGNSAAIGAGLAGEPLQQASSRSEAPDDLVVQNSIVFGNEGGGDISGFPERSVVASDVCSDGVAHTGAGNLCVDPKLAGPNTDGNVNQAAGGPTIDKGDATLVDGDLTKDYVGDARVIGGKVDMGADEYKPAGVQPPPPPVVTQPTPPAPAAGGVQGVQQRSCTSRRAFRIRIRVPKGKKALSAVVRVNNKKVKVVRGKRLKAAVRLTGLPKGRFKVRITVRLANGKKISGVRTYHTCIPRLPGDGPPKV